MQIASLEADANSPVLPLFEGLGQEMQVRFRFTSHHRPLSVNDTDSQVWMSHGDQLSAIPPGFHVVGRTPTAPFAAIAHESKPMYGIQFHPEVTHTPRGREVIARFVKSICRCKTNWTMVCDPFNTSASCP
jgi:GMP synthase-like glutamine amidotransferase